MIQAKKWNLFPPAPPTWLHNGGDPALLRQVLYNRGVRSEGEMAAFLNDAQAIQENPFRLKGMNTAVSRVLQAIDRNEVICVYGDFDADGVTATALLVSALQYAGGRVGPYIPNRVDEGYGLNDAAIETIAQQAQLIITVDCGIRAVEEVALANRLGVDVIITDHHSIGPVLPPALTVINPKQPDCPSSFKDLAGVGVAYRLAQAVLRAQSKRSQSSLSPDQAAELEESLLDLVAIGTVADMLPLQGENRHLVRRGLEQLNQTNRLGLEALYGVADVHRGGVDTTAISFRLAPRINAAGRMGDAMLAYKLLRTGDSDQAFQLAGQLEQLNKERRQLTTQAEMEADRQIQAQMAADADIYIVSSPDFRSGVVGLVAGRLTDRFYRPAVVIEQGEEFSRGSARSIQEFHITDALDEISHLLVRHGGHQMAAGFTLRTELLPDFQTQLAACARQTLAPYDGDLRPTLWLDAVLPLTEVNWGLQQQLARLEPTGNGNPSPLLQFNRCRVRRGHGVGGGTHLKLTLDSGLGSATVDAIGFSLGDWTDQMTEGVWVDLVARIDVNEWMGERRLQLIVEDLRLATDG